jgi:hypothetical protein
MSIGEAVFPLATRLIHIQFTRFSIEDATEWNRASLCKKQPSPVLEVEARLKMLPIHGGVENLGIHYDVVMNRLAFAFASCMRPHRTDVSGRAPFFEANNRVSLVGTNFDELSTAFLINATSEQFQIERLPPEYYSTH